ncbi:hypothetical protein E2C01_074934 [Portunus trituberculatus]|uniref:Uncharacterized protein n=1 Tax=Portunus trituberculatus TaxID=210409 RepID=A0A5B7IEG7_PORTR|nr:hypothetical protein [Portunus trituberculatus]
MVSGRGTYSYLAHTAGSVWLYGYACSLLFPTPPAPPPPPHPPCALPFCSSLSLFSSSISVSFSSSRLSRLITTLSVTVS